MGKVRVYRAEFKSGIKNDFIDPEDMIEHMLEENDLEALESLNVPQFDIDRDINAIRNLPVGSTWRHALGNVRCIELDKGDIEWE